MAPEDSRGVIDLERSVPGGKGKPPGPVNDATKKEEKGG